jgi:DNA-binding transcriptional MerR regulator
MASDLLTNTAIPKLGLNRIEAARALGLSPATIDRLTIKGLLRPSRATRRPIYSVKEIERFLKDTIAQPEWTV